MDRGAGALIFQFFVKSFKRFRDSGFIISLVGLVLWASPAQAFDITGIRTGIYNGQTRIVVELSEKAPYTAYTAANPDRVVIDLPEFRWQAGKVSQANGLKKLRYGSYQKGRGRIEFLTTSPSTINRTFRLASTERAPERLVIDFSPGAHANAAPGRVAGNFTQSPKPADAPLTAPAKTSDLKTRQPSSPPTPGQKERVFVVAIDAGHGGQDPGTLGNGGLQEKNITLAIARQLKKQLEAKGHYKIIMTRSSDIFIPLYDRVKIARKAGADLFVSIHADSISRNQVSGASLYTLSDKASDEQSARLAARENKADLIGGIDFGTQDRDVTNILVDLTRRDTMNQSRYFAKTLIAGFRGQNLQLLESPYRFAGFAVLKAPDIPSVLIETGYLSNPREAAMLNSPTHQRKLAASISGGIETYYQKILKSGRF